MKKNWFSLLILVLVFASCSGEEKSDEKKENNKDENKEIAENQEAGPLKQRIDDYVFSQDTSFESYSNKSSLPFLNNADQIELQSFFHYDANGVLKVVEEYQNTSKGQDIKRWYYKDDQVVCLTDIHVDYENEENWKQKKFYFENGSLNSVDEFTELDGPGSTVDFSSISSLMFHQNTSHGKNIVDLMGAFNGNIVMISKVDEPNKFAFYKITNYEQNITETEFYNTSLSYIDGNGSIEEDEFYFLSLLQFDKLSDTDKHYTHNQSVAGSTWSISHNLNKFPSVTAVLSTGQQGYGDVTFIDENNLTITFAGAESGKAYMN